VKVLFDTKIVLDVLPERELHVATAARLFSLGDLGDLEGAICATTATTVFHIAARSFGSKSAQAQVRDLLGLFDVAPVDRDVLTRALALDFADFEDAVLRQTPGASLLDERDGLIVQAVVVAKGDFDRAVLGIPGPASATVDGQRSGGDYNRDTQRHREEKDERLYVCVR
jgi:predicted nucleic acid-binding protein